jgi:P4 family phage/plasmid primase-like protien
VDLDIRVLEGSRPDSEGNVKYSYHVVGTNLIFASNTSPMKAFVQGFEEKLAKDKPSFLPSSDDDSPRHIIDMSVYTKNRVLRTPLSFKLSDSTRTPLKLLPPWDGPNDMTEVFVTNVAAGAAAGQRIFTMQDISRAIPAPATSATGSLPPAGAKRKEGESTLRARGGRGCKAAQATAPAMPSDVVQQLQALLDAAGNKGCQAKNDAGSLLDNGVLSFSCQNVGTRECLACKGVAHKSNNASLHVHQDSLRVYYKCLAPKCAKQAKIYIGVLKLEPDGALSATSASAGQAAAEMEVEDGAQPDSPYSGDQDVLDRASEAESLCSGSRIESLACSRLDEVVREFALLQPAADEEDLRYILELAAKAAGGQTEDCVKALQGAALEWSYRSLSVRQIAKYADSEEQFRAYQDEVTSFFVPDTRLPGCLDALAELQTARLSAEGWWKHEVEAEPYSNAYGKSMTADDFLRRVDTNSTHALSLVLAARLLWPREQDRFHRFITFNFKRERVHGLENKTAFAKVWGFAREEASEDFKECISTRMHIMAQPFLWEVLPSVLNGIKVASYQVSQDALSFWLDSTDYLESSVEYSFDFCTGNVTSSRGEGTIHRMYSVKRFFQDDGNINLMADVLAEQGIGNLMTFDQDDKHWRVYDETKGVWVHPKAACDPEVMVSRFIVRLLRPIKQAEDFFNKEVMWVDQGADVDEDAREGRAGDLSLGPSDPVSQVGSKRARSKVSALSKARVKKSKVAQALHTYSQNPRHQAEILKVLATRVIISFTGKQKPYLLCCPSGLLDLRTGELTRKPQADDYITQVCKQDYDPHADLTPATNFFKRYFPLEAYPDQAEIVSFLQQFLGYGLTMETEQQFCLVVYGKGSNGKSLLNKVLHDVLGGDLCRVIPVESLAKARGQNNDSLHDARFARVVTLEESHGRAKINTATFKNLVCGEEMTNKTMYKNETNFKPVMKLIFFLNELLADLNASDESDFPMLRRTAILNFQSIFVDEQKALEKKQADELRRKGLPECLIQVKDELYYPKHVEPHLSSFLRFMVDGAVTYYENNNHIDIPHSMQITAMQETTTDLKAMLKDFVQARLVPTPPADGKKLMVSEIEDAFKAFAQEFTNVTSLDRAVFGKFLQKAIDARKSENARLWQDVYRDQHRVGGEKPMFWFHLYWRPAELSTEERFANPSQNPSQH